MNQGGHGLTPGTEVLILLLPKLLLTKRPEAGFYLNYQALYHVTLPPWLQHTGPGNW